MPYILDLKNKCERLYTMDVEPYGWINNPQKIEYGLCLINQNDPDTAMCFKLIDTPHVWSIFEKELNRISHGNYKQYFTAKLEEFRLYFLDWIHQPDTWKLDWVKEYYDMFKGKFYDFSEEEKKTYDEFYRQKHEFTSMLKKYKEDYYSK